jgi:hypothetical protein
MTYSRAEQAARNNAIWCDTVCRAHGVAGEFFDSVWINRRPSPPYYPNVVTLRDTSAPTAALRQIRELIELPLPGDWAAKDSFCTLDLAALGFDLLFEASWIWHGPLPCEPIAQSPKIQWVPVASSAELALWETGWSASAGSVVVADEPRQFPSSLLADRNVIIWLVTNAQVAFPGMPVVGYQQGRSLEAARTCGFEVVEELRVWLRQGTMALPPRSKGI